MAIEAKGVARQYGSKVPTSDYSRPDLGSASPPSPDVGETGGGEEESNRQRTETGDNTGRKAENRRSRGQPPATNRRSSDPAPENQNQPRVPESRHAVINPETGPESGDSGRLSPEPVPEVPEPSTEQSQPQTQSQNNPSPETEGEATPGTEAGGQSEGPRGLSEEERRQVQELRKIDRKVRSHEQAHVGAGGQYVKSRAKFEYSYGPNGNRYAVGGEVKLDTGKSRTPEKTIKKMQQVRSAALAPADPSSQDYSVARKAARKASKARMKLSKEKREGSADEGQDSGTVAPEQPENQESDRDQSPEEAGGEPAIGEGPAGNIGRRESSEDSSPQQVTGRNQPDNRIQGGAEESNRPREQQTPAGRQTVSERAGENSEQGSSVIYDQFGGEQENSVPAVGRSGQNSSGAGLNLLA